MTVSTWDHNNANEMLTITGIHVAHDAAGNMTKVIKPGSFTVHYDTTYDAWNRLVEVKEGMTTVATYEYDGFGRRIEAGSDDFYYSDSWQVLWQDTTNESEYVWHPQYVDSLAVRHYDSDNNGNYTGTNETHYPTYDANYNVTALIDRSAGVIERYEYTPYGEVSFLDASFGDIGSSTVDNPVLYTGRRFDSDTGLYYYRHRYYHAQLGRFLTRDPIEFEGSEWNLYEYVNGRPINGVDPQGTEAVDTGVKICNGYKKGGWLFGWFSIHGFISIDGKGCGFFEQNNNPCCTGQFRTDDLDTYPEYHSEMTPGTYYSTCTEVTLDDRCNDPSKFANGVRDCIKEMQANPGKYCVGFRDCFRWVKGCIASARYKSRIPGRPSYCGTFDRIGNEHLR